MKPSLFLIWLFPLFLAAQNQDLIQANKFYNELAYPDAAALYTKVVKKGASTPEIYQKLGNSYYFIADYKNAVNWYAKLFENEEIIAEPEYYYKYAQSLKSIGDYEKATVYLKKFIALKPNDSRSLAFIENSNYLSKILEQPSRYKIFPLDFNTHNSDFGGSFCKDKFVFSSARENENKSKKAHKWTNKPYTDLYYATVNKDNSFSAIDNFDAVINTKFNESSAVFSKDGKTMYFTSNTPKTKKNKDQLIVFKIYKATLVSEQWTNIIELPFNSDSFNCAHPALSPDEKTLYFASDMPGTFGLSDIFKVAITAKGNFGKPQNLGKKINTSARESFPFITDDNVLYFASDGQLGLGGYDIFGVKIISENQYSKVLNVGISINSEFDDFSYAINTQTKIGFFSSNRSGGKGEDDIYKFIEEIPLSFQETQTIKGTITRNSTMSTIPFAKVTLLNTQKEIIASKNTSESGEFEFTNLPNNAKFFIRTEVDNLATNETEFDTNTIAANNTLKINIKEKVIQFDKNTDLAKILNIANIYFDLNKYEITPKAAEKLQIILSFLEKNRNVKIDIRSHTDSRNSDFFNLNLSNSRAKSTTNWLISKGIDADRLTYKGFGETQLKNKCANGIKCTAQEHSENRRSEFIIVNN